MIKAYMKVLRTIQSAEYQHLTNGSVENLINNFNNMYSKDRAQHRELLSLFNARLKSYENSN